ncbi:oligosaccharide flippase family protein [Siccirubricoccus sp. KC 17139]|uniref:Oligosaccharide flippase family protein n=1 Tax=Siccirubricoccus soli TaxID=2899147 RepID=A0ABT1D5W0_9PROT|nr:oligosaccharide flippase family protein [Siccirubricoccus soli]MCO6417320.1 oligosaccharide flippase family protein [Siccirubricoccus soli]MCP2683455.1 oligosaccharide flippase family protein [Siccirubricoccus soli]
MSPPDPAAEPLHLAARRVARGAASLAVGQVLARAIGMGFTLALAHLLPIEAFGTWNLALSALVLAGLVQDAGLSRTVVKEVARAPASAAHWIGHLLPLKLGLGLLAVPLLPLLGWAAGFGAETTRVLAVIALALPAANLWLLLENAGQGLHAIRALTLGAVATAGLQTACGLTAAWLSGGSLPAIAAGFVLAGLLNLLLMWRWIGRLAGPLRWRRAPGFVKRVLRDSLPYLGVALAMAALGRVEVLLLGRLAGEAEVALFTAGFKLFEAALFLIHAAQIALNPTLARLIQVDRPGFARWFGWQMGLPAALLLPAVLLALPVAQFLVWLLYPIAYAPAAVPLAVLSLALPVTALQLLASGALVLTDRQGQAMLAQGAVVAAQIGLNLLLIPRFGALGAALAIAGSQALGAALGLGLVRRLLLPGWAALAPLFRMLAVQGAALGLGLAVALVFRHSGAGVAAAALGWAAGLAAIRFRPSPPQA